MPRLCSRTIPGVLACVLLCSILAAAQPSSGPGPAGAQPDRVKIGFVMFLSGPAAEPFGIPARNAAELMVEAINEGVLPGPYNSAGLAGARIEPLYVDEAGQQAAAEYRNLILNGKADAIIGYISSGNCEQVAPLVDELGRVTIFFDCGTPTIFEDIVTKPKLLFRTGALSTMDSVAAARFLAARHTDSRVISGINQDYSWGRESWAHFKAAMAVVGVPGSVGCELFPKLFKGEYGPEISQLLSSKANVIHSSFWGRDMEAFVIQASASKVFEQSAVILTTGESALQRLASQIPEGAIIGARGPHGPLAPATPLNEWFTVAYFNRYGMLPTYPAYKMAQALLGLKKAYDMTQTRRPAQEEVAAALTNLEFESPSGTVKMALAGGHQAIQDTAYGVYSGGRTVFPELKGIVRYKAECVNPPDGVRSEDWIQSGFRGSQCH